MSDQANGIHLSELLCRSYALYKTRDAAMNREAAERGIADAKKKHPDLPLSNCWKAAEAELTIASQCPLLMNEEVLSQIGCYGGGRTTLQPFVVSAMGEVQPRHKDGIDRALNAWRLMTRAITRRVRCKCDEQRLAEYSLNCGAVPASKLSAEIDRIHETGLTRELADALWTDYPDEAREMGLNASSPPPVGAGIPPVTYTIATVLEMAGVCDTTLSKYAKLAGVSTPSRGKRNHLYTADEVRAILQTTIDQSSDRTLKDRCHKALNQL